MIKNLNGVAAFLDYLTVTVSEKNTHRKNLETLFDRIKELGCTVKAEKCKFFSNKVLSIYRM